MVLWVLEGKTADGHQFVERIVTSEATARMELTRCERQAEDPDHMRHGSHYHLRNLHVEVELFDLWRMIRHHPAYAFGALFVQGDFDRGIPHGFDMPKAEEMLVKTGREHIDGLYEGEPALQRLLTKFRR